MVRLEDGFHAAMQRIYIEAKKAGYTASYFHQMVEEMGGLAAAKKLINDNTPSEGFTRLWQMKRLDLSVEAEALNPKWRDLFSAAERLKARKRLEEYGFRVKAP